MLGLKEVANKNMMRKEEENKRIDARKKIDRMFVDFINENLDEIHEFFPTTKLYDASFLYGASFKATQKDHFKYDDFDTYLIEMTPDNKIVIRQMIKNFNNIEIPFKLDDNKSVLYRKFKNAIKTLVSIGYNPDKDSKLAK